MTGVAIGGVTATGNMGGVAMLEATLQEVSKRLPDADYFLLSIAPQADRSVVSENRLTVVPARPLLLVGVYLP